MSDVKLFQLTNAPSTTSSTPRSPWRGASSTHRAAPRGVPRGALPRLREITQRGRRRRIGVCLTTVERGCTRTHRAISIWSPTLGSASDSVTGGGHRGLPRQARRVRTGLRLARLAESCIQAASCRRCAASRSGQPRLGSRRDLSAQIAWKATDSPWPPGPVQDLGAESRNCGHAVDAGSVAA